MTADVGATPQDETAPDAAPYAAPAGLETVLGDEGWTDAIPDPAALAEACFAAAARLETALAGAQAALLLTDDAAMRDLNARFRDRDAPTNVLAFPADLPAGTGPRFLGDIALARETCLREAAAKGAAPADHAAHLIVHGVLHLIGYDHQEEEDAARMERRETAILAALGVADPYAEEPYGNEPYGDEVGTL